MAGLISLWCCFLHQNFCHFFLCQGTERMSLSIPYAGGYGSLAWPHTGQLLSSWVLLSTGLASHWIIAKALWKGIYFCAVIASLSCSCLCWSCSWLVSVWRYLCFWLIWCCESPGGSHHWSCLLQLRALHGHELNFVPCSQLLKFEERRKLQPANEQWCVPTAIIIARRKC